jgi:hypothetical protein
MASNVKITTKRPRKDRRQADAHGKPSRAVDARRRHCSTD